MNSSCESLVMIERDGVERDGIERDGIERDGIERDGIEGDRTELGVRNRKEKRRKVTGED